MVGSQCQRGTLSDADPGADAIKGQVNKAVVATIFRSIYGHISEAGMFYCNLSVKGVLLVPIQIAIPVIMCCAVSFNASGKWLVTLSFRFGSIFASGRCSHLNYVYPFRRLYPANWQCAILNGLPLNFS